MSTRSITGLSEVLSWQVASADGERLEVELRGEVNENADFSELGRQLHGDVTLFLDGITRINSCGVREWVNFMRGLKLRSLVFARCSPTVIVQVNTIYNFRGPARVQSFLAPYVCETCHIDEYKLLDVAQHFPDRARLSVPGFLCGRCGGVMTFDELPGYLAFLAEPDRGSAST